MNIKKPKSTDFFNNVLLHFIATSVGTFKLIIVPVFPEKLWVILPRIHNLVIWNKSLK